MEATQIKNNWICNVELHTYTHFTLHKHICRITKFCNEILCIYILSHPPFGVRKELTPLLEKGSCSLPVRFHFHWVPHSWSTTRLFVTLYQSSYCICRLFLVSANEITRSSLWVSHLNHLISADVSFLQINSIKCLRFCAH